MAFLEQFAVSSINDLLPRDDRRGLFIWAFAMRVCLDVRKGAEIDCCRKLEAPNP